jgi:uncharacterized membrane protein YoaK (UPF0700 family)
MNPFKDHPTDPIFSRSHAFIGFALAMAAGTINVGGFLAFGRFVSHVTGFATLFGGESSSGRWVEAFELLSVPIFFLLGSMLSAYLIDRKRHQGHKPDLHWAMWIVTLNLGVASWLGAHDFFSAFGGGLDLTRDYLLLALLSLASGTMNGLITSASSGALRSTHLTGTTTDLGLGLVRVMFPNNDSRRHLREVRANWLRVGTIAFFVTGSLLGGLFFRHKGYHGFFLPTLLTLGLAIYLTLARLSALRESV